MSKGITAKFKGKISLFKLEFGYLGEYFPSVIDPHLVPSLGRNLKVRRLAYGRITGKRETLERAAARLNVDPKTLREMERGSLAVSLGKYVKAAELYGGMEGFERLFEDPAAKESSLFAGWPQE